MAKNYRIFTKIEKMRFLVSGVIILLVILAGFFVYQYFFSNKTHSYLIENKYYGFKLKTPENWIGEENTLYSENNITQLLTKCKDDKSNSASVYEIGAFRFKSQKYPQDFGISGTFATGLPSGVILELTVNCVPDSVKAQIGNYSGNLKVAGEPALEEFLNLPVFGKTEELSFLHNNFQYKVTKYVYISPGDKNNPEKLRENYARMFNKIVSSVEFIK